VIVTGGTAGFGFVLARHLVAAGAQVLVVGRSSEGVRLALAALETAGRNVRGVAADLARPGEGRRVVGECLRMLGGVDDLFCCVGRSGRGRILETPEDELREYLDANLFAAAEITQAAADDVAAAKGHVVYIGSLAGKLVVPYMGAYSVAKSALAAFADAVRLASSTPRPPPTCSPGRTAGFQSTRASGSHSPTAMCPALFVVSSIFSDTAPGRPLRWSGSP